MEITRRKAIVSTGIAIGGAKIIGPVSAEGELLELETGPVSIPAGGSIEFEIEEDTGEDVLTEIVNLEDGVESYELNDLENETDSMWSLSVTMTEGDDGSSPTVDFPAEVTASEEEEEDPPAGGDGDSGVLTTRNIAIGATGTAAVGGVAYYYTQNGGEVAYIE